MLSSVGERSRREIGYRPVSTTLVPQSGEPGHGKHQERSSHGLGSSTSATRKSGRQVPSNGQLARTDPRSRAVNRSSRADRITRASRPRSSATSTPEGRSNAWWPITWSIPPGSSRRTSRTQAPRDRAEKSRRQDADSTKVANPARANSTEGRSKALREALESLDYFRARGATASSPSTPSTIKKSRPRSCPTSGRVVRGRWA